MPDKSKFSLELLKQEAKEFCRVMSRMRHKEIVGVTDGKAVGTLIEHKFRERIAAKYDVRIGSSAEGIDFPSEDINTDVKTTSITQPQSSSPFRNARQKIRGLGYNILLFVYMKDDSKKANLDFVYCVFIEKSKTADYQTTKGILDILDRKGNRDDIIAFLTERNLPVDDIEMGRITDEILEDPPQQGYLTISNALQWRLQYSRVIYLEEPIEGIFKITDSNQKNRRK